jgi:hypothetical protein
VAIKNLALFVRQTPRVTDDHLSLSWRPRTNDDGTAFSANDFSRIILVAKIGPT